MSRRDEQLTLQIAETLVHLGADFASSAPTHPRDALNGLAQLAPKGPAARALELLARLAEHRCQLLDQPGRPGEAEVVATLLESQVGAVAETLLAPVGADEGLQQCLRTLEETIQSLEANPTESATQIMAERPDPRQQPASDLGSSSPNSPAEAFGALFEDDDLGAAEGEESSDGLAGFLAMLAHPGQDNAGAEKAVADPDPKSDTSLAPRSRDRSQSPQRAKPAQVETPQPTTDSKLGPIFEDDYAASPGDQDAMAKLMAMMSGGADAPKPKVEPKPEVATKLPGDHAPQNDRGNRSAPATPSTPSPQVSAAPPAAASSPSSGDEDLQSELNAMLALDEELRMAFLADAEDLSDRLGDLVATLDAQGATPDRLGDLCRCLHTLKGAAGSIGLMKLGEQVHRLEDTIQEEAPKEGPLPDPLRDRIHGCLELVDSAIGRLRDGPEAGGPEPTATSTDATDPSAPQSPSTAESDGPHPAIGSDHEAQAESTTTTQTLAGPVRSAAPAATSSGETLLRVPSVRVDRLMDLVGDLVLRRGTWAKQSVALQGFAAEARLSRNRLLADIDRLGDLNVGLAEPLRWQIEHLARRLSEQAGDLAALAETARAATGPVRDDGEALAQTTLQLWTELQSIRVVPVRGLFQRLTRAAQDAARVEGRRIAVITDGEQTGMDRSVQDKAYEPLLHLVRNAVGHGIEPPEQRRAAGKAEQGTIRIAARREGNTLTLEIRDDGRGLDRQRILEKARRVGLIGPDEQPSSVERIDQLIFEPGFSTRDAANAIAGRGVGMDVVSREVANLHGTIHLESEPGHGCRIAIRLPARVALEPAMVFGVGDHLVALPIAVLERIGLAPEPDQIPPRVGQPITLSDGPAAYVPLEPLLGFPPTSPPAPRSCPKLLLVRTANQRLAVAVERIVGPEELVIRPLDPLLAGHPALAGTSLSTEGAMILLLDPTGLARLAQRCLGPVPRPAQPTPDPIARPGRVLVVDDSVSARKVARRHLRGLGLEVDEAVDGLDALGRLRDDDANYCLVLSDLEMPRMDGAELLSELDRLGILATTPVVVATTRTDEPTRRTVLSRGAHAILPKPIAPDAWNDPILKLARSGPVQPVAVAVDLGSQPNREEHGSEDR